MCVVDMRIEISHLKGHAPRPLIGWRRLIKARADLIVSEETDLITLNRYEGIAVVVVNAAEAIVRISR